MASGLALCLAVAIVLVAGSGIASAVEPAFTTVYALPGGTGSESTGCISAGDDCSLASALSAADSDAQTAPVTVMLEPNPSSSSKPKVFYGTWTLNGGTAADPITLDGNGQILDGDQGTTTGVCEPYPTDSPAGCEAPVLKIDDSGTYVIENVTIQNANDTNKAYTAYGDGGGGLENKAGGNVTVTDATFANDIAYTGGAIDNGDYGSGSMTVSDSTFYDDSAVGLDGQGGAIDNGLGGSGTLTVSDSTFDDDSAPDGYGGAIDNASLYGSGSLSVSDSTFTNDTAGNEGGAIDNADGNGSVGNVWTAGDVFAGTCTSGLNNGNGSWHDEGYNVGDSSCFGSPGGTGDVAVATSSALKLGPLAPNGGPTQTIALQAGSPAIGIVPANTSVTLGPTGSSTSQLVQLCSDGATDQRGDRRPGPCDAGAYEYTATSGSGTGTGSGSGTGTGSGSGTGGTTSTGTTITPTTPFTGITNLNPVIMPIQVITIPLRTTVAHSCKVPKLSGLTLSKALAELTSAGCRVGSLYEVSSVRSKGKVKTKLKRFKPTSTQKRLDKVTKLSPGRGKKLTAGHTLTFSISQLG